jgi:hypothetical protein
MADPEILQQNLTHFTAPGDASGHSGPVVTHRLASGARPAGQQVCANAGDISAYVKTRIAGLRYRIAVLPSALGRRSVAACHQRASRAAFTPIASDISPSILGDGRGDRPSDGRRDGLKRHLDQRTITRREARNWTRRGARRISPDQKR